MKISVDGGALCVPSHKRFGTYTFSFNLLSALSVYDKSNAYYIYSFCKKPSSLALESNTFYKVMQPKTLWMKGRVSYEEMRVPKDIFLALNQAIPLFSRAEKIGFSHGLSFLKHPKLYRYGGAQLKKQLATMLKKCKYIVVSSEKVKEEILHLHPKKNNQVIILPCGIPFDFVNYEEQKREPFFLFSGMNHPVKNVEALIDIFTDFNSNRGYSSFQLYMIGPFEKFKNKHKKIIIYPKLTREKMKSLYQKATAYVTASHYESFNFPILEALSQGCPVIGMHDAIIPEFIDHAIVAKNKEEFIDSMIAAADGKAKMPDIHAVKKQFTWKQYVQNLTKLY